MKKEIFFEMRGSQAGDTYQENAFDETKLAEFLKELTATPYEDIGRRESTELESIKIIAIK